MLVCSVAVHILTWNLFRKYVKDTMSRTQKLNTWRVCQEKSFRKTALLICTNIRRKHLTKNIIIYSVYPTTFPRYVLNPKKIIHWGIPTESWKSRKWYSTLTRNFYPKWQISAFSIILFGFVSKSRRWLTRR